MIFTLSLETWKMFINQPKKKKEKHMLLAFSVKMQKRS